MKQSCMHFATFMCTCMHRAQYLPCLKCVNHSLCITIDVSVRPVLQTTHFKGPPCGQFISSNLATSLDFVLCAVHHWRHQSSWCNVTWLYLASNLYTLGHYTSTRWILHIVLIYWLPLQKWDSHYKDKKRQSWDPPILMTKIPILVRVYPYTV